MDGHHVVAHVVAGGQVPWVIDTASGIAANDARILAAIAHWEDKTCIDFRPRTNETNYLKFVFSNSSCSSPVGMNYRTYNYISIGNGCGMGNIVYEIGHSLGLAHEHSRQDRDQFVYVNLTAVMNGQDGNFGKATGRDLMPYNYGSIMHDGCCGFAINPNIPTIVSPQPIGQRDGLNDGDVAAIMFMYQNCAADTAPITCVA